MIISGGAKRSRVLGVALPVLCLAMLVVAGCGPDGNAGVDAPPRAPLQPLVTGVVRLPNGELVSANSLWKWAKSTHLVSPAYAITQNPSVFPANNVRVSLSRVDHADAADGVIGDNSGSAPVPVSIPSDTNSNGQYTIYKTTTARTVDGCGFMLAVGDPRLHTLTRAFVADVPPTDPAVAAEVDIDVVSETVVRVVLDRLTKAQAVDLCEFQLGSPGLQGITDAVANAVYTATGTNIEELNQSAFEKAIVNPFVKAAVYAATGVPVDN